MQRIRDASAEEVARAEARRTDEFKALAERNAAEVNRLKTTYADKEMRAAREKTEAERIYQKLVRERDADMAKRDKAMAEKEADLARQNLALSKQNGEQAEQL